MLSPPSPAGAGRSPSGSRSPSKLSPGTRSASRLSSKSSNKAASEIVVTVRRVDGRDKGETFRIQCGKRITIQEIKERVFGEWSIAFHEQVLIFRGQRVNDDDRAMPLNTPDLAEIVQEAGENGLQMSVMYLPRRLPAFMKREKFEDINSKRTTMATALHRAARRGELNVMEEILNHPDFDQADARDGAGQTALHAAVVTWNRPGCEILLKHNKFSASYVADEEGRTALHIAASWGDTLVVQWIVEHWRFRAEEVNWKDSFGCTALDYARDCGHEQAVELIAQAAKGRAA
mmetsp:Transcript_48984/g.151212  ORF Transcript_48984/g.151212 Transcript_48984/m.151212 type:complete len:290 (+) Transcript_48984:105-974(+)